jgi:hypothetical protein
MMNDVQEQRMCPTKMTAMALPMAAGQRQYPRPYPYPYQMPRNINSMALIAEVCLESFSVDYS